MRWESFSAAEVAGGKAVVLRRFFVPGSSDAALPPALRAEIDSLVKELDYRRPPAPWHPILSVSDHDGHLYAVEEALASPWQTIGEWRGSGQGVGATAARAFLQNLRDRLSSLPEAGEFSFHGLISAETMLVNTESYEVAFPASVVIARCIGRIGSEGYDNRSRDLRDAVRLTLEILSGAPVINCELTLESIATTPDQDAELIALLRALLESSASTAPADGRPNAEPAPLASGDRPATKEDVLETRLAPANPADESGKGPLPAPIFSSAAGGKVRRNLWLAAAAAFAVSAVAGGALMLTIGSRTEARASAVQLEGPRITRFTSDKSTLRVGEAVTLSYETENATSVILYPNGTLSKDSGFVTVPVAETTLFTLVAASDAGSASQVIRVQVRK